MIDITHTKLGQHLPQVGELDELLLLPLTTDVATRLKPGPKDLLVLEELGADEWQNSHIGFLECSVCSSQMMKPRVEVDDRLVLLVQGQEGRQSLDLLWASMLRI